MNDGANIAFGTTTGTQLGTGSTQKLGFYGATPVVKPTSTTDLRAALINLGLYTTGGASPLDLNGGRLTFGDMTAGSLATLATSTTAGLTICTGVTQQVAFWGATPIGRPGERRAGRGEPDADEPHRLDRRHGRRRRSRDRASPTRSPRTRSPRSPPSWPSSRRTWPTRRRS
jgi:hypothetical protein